jgi:hypothetical protein
MRLWVIQSRLPIFFQAFFLGGLGRLSVPMFFLCLTSVFRKIRTVYTLQPAFHFIFSLPFPSGGEFFHINLNFSLEARAFLGLFGKGGIQA